ncbi:MAG: AAA family ATPase [Pseudomonadota bacterium]
MAEIIAICNQKGGVGKTTTAINLSACLAAAEKRTLLIDIDAQANATTGLGIDKDNIPKTIYDVLMNDSDIESAILHTPLEYLKMIPSSGDLVGAEVELVSVLAREKRLKNSLEKINDDFDYIIIDCPPSLGIVTLNALTAANSVLIPVQCEFYAMEGMVSLHKTIEVVRDCLNPDLKVKGIVLTMHDKRNNLSAQVIDNIREYFKNKVFQVIIPRNVRLSEAPSHGKPIILYDVNSKGASAYLTLAQEVLMNSTS